LHDPWRLRETDRVVEFACQQRKLQQARHPLRVGLSILHQAERVAAHLFEAGCRADLNHDVRLFITGIPPVMGDAGRRHELSAEDRDVLVPVQPEANATPPYGEPLLERRVDMLAEHGAARPCVQISHQQRAGSLLRADPGRYPRGSNAHRARQHHTAAP
jgi:hypothetical protein